MIFYEVEPFETVDDFTVDMLRTNSLPEVIQFGIKDNQILLPISNLIPLEEYLKSLKDREDIDRDEIENKLVLEYEAIREKIENYMIPKEELILNFFYSYIDKDEETLVLPVVPTDYSHFESHSHFEFKSAVHCTLETLPKANEKETKKQKKLRPKKEKKFFNKIIKVLEESGKDDIFEFSTDGALPEGIHVVVVRSTGDEYPLMFGPDLIGNDENRCSIAFPGNRAMSAEHCSITLTRGKYYIADLNSEAGTFLNGIPLEPGKTYELSSADLITVAGEELVFSKRI